MNALNCCKACSPFNIDLTLDGDAVSETVPDLNYMSLLISASNKTLSSQSMGCNGIKLGPFGSHLHTPFFIASPVLLMCHALLQVGSVRGMLCDYCTL